MDVYSRDGSVLTTIGGADEAVWLDAAHFIVSSWHRRPGPVDAGSEVVIGPGGHPEATSFLVPVDGLEAEELEVGLAGAVSNGTGVLAITTCRACQGANAMFRAWTLEAGLSDQQPGDPTSWSISGDRLLLEHPLGEGPTSDRWMEIVTWPEFQHYYGSRADTNAFVLDPNWQKRATWAGDVANIIVLPSGETVSTFTAPLTGTAVWDASDRLLIAEYSTASAVAYNMSGDRVAAWDDIGQQVMTSPDGSTMAWWHFDDGSRHDLNLIRGDEFQRVELPGPLDQLRLSPDGLSIVAVVFVGDMFSVLLSPM